MIRQEKNTVHAADAFRVARLTVRLFARPESSARFTNRGSLPALIPDNPEKSSPRHLRTSRDRKPAARSILPEPGIESDQAGRRVAECARTCHPRRRCQPRPHRALRRLTDTRAGPGPHGSYVLDQTDRICPAGRQVDPGLIVLVFENDAALAGKRSSRIMAWSDVLVRPSRAVRSFVCAP